MDFLGLALNTETAAGGGVAALSLLGLLYAIVHWVSSRRTLRLKGPGGTEVYVGNDTGSESESERGKPKLPVVCPVHETFVSEFHQEKEKTDRILLIVGETKGKIDTLIELLDRDRRPPVQT